MELFGHARNRSHNRNQLQREPLQLQQLVEPRNEAQNEAQNDPEPHNAIVLNASRPDVRTHQSLIAIERRVEELAEMVGATGSALNELLVISAHGQEMNLDRFSQLKSQITRENQKLMHAISRIRQESRCNLSDPRTYAYCIKLMYQLIFNIFYLLCQLIFVVGGSINNFLFHIPLTGGILVILGIAFQALLFFLLFDTTVYVSTVSLSHREVFNHDRYFQHLNGANQMVGANMLLYEGLILFLIKSSKTVVNVIVTGHRIFLGRITNRLFRIMQREIGNPQTIVETIVEDVVDKGKEKVTEFVKESINHQIEDLTIIPNQVAIMAGQATEIAGQGVAGMASLAERGVSLAGEGVAGAASLAERGVSLAGRGAAGVTTFAGQGLSLAGEGVAGMASLAERGVSLAGRGAAGVTTFAGQGLSLAGEGAAGAASLAGRGVSSMTSLAGKGMEDLRESGVMEGLGQRAENIKHGFGRFASRFTTRFGGARRTKKLKKIKKITPIPKFSILTKNEEKEFDKTFTGKKLKYLKKRIDSINYSNVPINPKLFYMTQFVLNLTENLFPIFIGELDRSLEICKKLKDVDPALNKLHNELLEKIIDIVTI
jgi:hypothetical protein